VHENRDKRFHNNPMQSVSGGQFNPIPRAMIEMLAKMKLEEDIEDQSQAGKQPREATEAESTKTTTTNLNQQSTTPSKRKFQKIPHATQVIAEGPSTSNPKNTMVSLSAKASQGQ
jgi:hypothetical protein